MKEQIKTLTACFGQGNRIFALAAFHIDPVSDLKDKVMVEEMFEIINSFKAVDLAPSGKKRDQEVLFKTRYLGVLSENILQKYFQKNVPEGCSIEKSPFTDIHSHIDLEITGKNRSISLEIRGSYPYSNLKSVIFSLFDVIGPYKTRYKPGEKVNDFYLRTLINCDIREFNPHAPHTLYFAGGAERELFSIRGYLSDFDQEGAQYFAIKPIARGRDALEIISLINSRLTEGEISRKS